MASAEEQEPVSPPNKQRFFFFLPLLTCLKCAHTRSTGGLFYTLRCHHHFTAGPILKSRERQGKGDCLGKGKASFPSTCPGII